jgi:pimeloyl-ACP methyl ester carboxylesterase
LYGRSGIFTGANPSLNPLRPYRVYRRRTNLIGKMTNPPRLFKSLISWVIIALLIHQVTPVQAEGSISVYLPYLANVIHYSLTVTYRSGQTFITWPELASLQGEKYRVYRSINPFSVENLRQATLLGEVGKDSARFYANRYKDRTSLVWTYRFVDRYVTQDFGPQVPAGTGLLVWTLESQDFGGASSGSAYYAVTVTPPGGAEIFDPTYTAGPIVEAVADPLPVEINSATTLQLYPGAHIFIQYMNLRRWNPTFHAPNPSNYYYGVAPTDPGVADDLQYAYDYLVYVPTSAMCGGQLPSKLPVIFNLHGHQSNTYIPKIGNPDLYCAYVILPLDESDTWYFGFARLHDYRQGGEVSAGDTIVNYTEQRVLRMLYDLERKPVGPAVDARRVYVEGQSMGASGAMAFAERYPNVFAAAYASQPITNYRTAGVTTSDWVADVTVKWGKPQLNLPISIDAPNGWASHLQKYNGLGVWDWQNYQASASATNLHERLYDDMAPIGMIFGIKDHVVTWSTQGLPTLTSFNVGRRAWGSLITNDDHYWMYYYGLPPGLAPVGRDKYSWVPYWNLSVVKDETIPGLSNLSTDSNAEPGGRNNQTIQWSSSWNNWDGSPIDQSGQWQISLCTVSSLSLGSVSCGSGVSATVDVTPRRVQHFNFAAGARYSWENRLVSDNSLVASGTVTADSRGLVLIPGFLVTPWGDRLVIKPAP